MKDRCQRHGTPLVEIGFDAASAVPVCLQCRREGHQEIQALVADGIADAAQVHRALAEMAAEERRAS